MNTSLRIAPEFIEPKTIRELSEEDQATLVQGIRDRRLIAVTQYLQAQEEKKQIKEAALAKKMDRCCDKIARYVEKIDIELAKIEGEFGKLRVIRFEAFDTV
jgi:hypothetical protein